MCTVGYIKSRWILVGPHISRCFRQRIARGLGAFNRGLGAFDRGLGAFTRGAPAEKTAEPAEKPAGPAKSPAEAFLPAVAGPGMRKVYFPALPRVFQRFPRVFQRAQAPRITGRPTRIQRDFIEKLVQIDGRSFNFPNSLTLWGCSYWGSFRLITNRRGIPPYPAP